MWTTGKDFKEEREDDGHLREENQSCHFFDEIVFAIKVYDSKLHDCANFGIFHDQQSKSCVVTELPFRLFNFIWTQKIIHNCINVCVNYNKCPF